MRERGTSARAQRLQPALIVPSVKRHYVERAAHLDHLGRRGSVNEEGDCDAGVISPERLDASGELPGKDVAHTIVADAQRIVHKPVDTRTNHRVANRRLAAVKRRSSESPAPSTLDLTLERRPIIGPTIPRSPHTPGRRPEKDHHRQAVRGGPTRNCHPKQQPRTICSSPCSPT
jgi:hypothetical protein